MNGYHMTRQDKIDFIHSELDNVLITDNTEVGYVSAMKQLLHIGKDKRFPSFIRAAVGVVFSQIEDGNSDAEDMRAMMQSEIDTLKARLGESEEDYSNYEDVS